MSCRGSVALKENSLVWPNDREPFSVCHILIILFQTILYKNGVNNPLFTLVQLPNMRKNTCPILASTKKQRRKEIRSSTCAKKLNNFFQ
jgi:hypothetical protein